MNVIGQLFHTDTQVHASKCTLAANVRASEVLIMFNGNTCAVYDKDVLKKLDYFKNILEKDEHTETVQLEFNSDMFNAAISLILEKKQLCELSKEVLQNPTLYEELIKIIDLLQPESSKEILNDLKHNHLPFLSLENAETVVAAFKKFLVTNSPKPIYVSCAYEVLKKSKLFATKEEAIQYFDDLCEYQKEKNITVRLLKTLENSRGNLRNSEIQVKLIESQIINLKRNYETCSDEIEMLQDKTRYLSMMQRQYLQRHLDDANEEIRNLAITSKAQLEGYCGSILKALEGSQANIQRQDLLEYIVGPKCYLFDHYGLVIDPKGGKYPFAHKGVRSNFGYRLENEGAWHLEEEIRTDLQGHHIHLCERVITKKESTIPITQEVKLLQEQLFPILNDWNDCPDTDVVLLKNTLIKFNGWEDLGITAADIRIHNPTEKNPGIVRGIFNKWGQKVDFHMSTRNFIMLIPFSADHHSPDKVSTREMLLKLRERQYSNTQNFTGGLKSRG